MKNKQNMKNDLELNHIETANMVSKQIIIIMLFV